MFKDMKLRKDRKETTPQPEQTLQPNSAQKKEKRRLSGLFGSKKSKDGQVTEHEPVITSPIVGNSTHALNPNPSLQNSSIQDSAYANSETDATPLSGGNMSGDTSTNTVPVENHGQIPGVSAERDLTLNKLTGDVTDDNTGEVVTTTTTMTTTTTTTTKGGKPVSTEVAVEPSASLQPGAPNLGHRDSNVSEMPDNAVQPPTAQTLQPQASYGDVNNAPPMSATGALDPNPNVPQRSPNRRSRDLGQSTLAQQRISEVSEPDPESPIQGFSGGANFSYPARAGGPNAPAPLGGGLSSHPVSPTTTGGSPPYTHSNAGATAGLTPQPQQNQSGIFANLKAAAKGIHGVGETLRGTLNSEIDNRFPRKDVNKAAAANAKNQNVLQTGQRELEGVRVER